MTRVAIPELRQLIVRYLRPRFSEAHAGMIADVALFGEMAGRPSHGILRVLPGSYGVMDEEPGPPPLVTWSAASAASVEGRPGMLVAAIGAELCEELAGASGFAVVTTRGSRSTSGSLAYHVERLARAGLVSFVSAGTVDFVSFPGAGKRALGTNPFAFGIPGGERPFVLDMATSAISGGDVLTAVAEGRDLPPGVALDPEGSETIDPQDVLAGGALLPFGGHKGLGLAMMVEILNKTLTGATGDPGDWGHVFVAFALDLIGDEDQARERAEAEMERLRGAGARIPGQESLARRDEALRRGWVEVDDDAFRRLEESVGPS